MGEQLALWASLFSLGFSELIRGLNLAREGPDLTSHVCACVERQRLLAHRLLVSPRKGLPQEFNLIVSLYRNKSGFILTGYSTLSLNLLIQVNITKYAVVISQSEQSQMSSALFTSANHALLLDFEKVVRAKSLPELNLLA
jgi:hypothetical protein